MSLSQSLGRPFRFTFTPCGRTLLYLRNDRRTRDARLYAFDLTTREERLLASATRLLNGHSKQTAAERTARERRRIKVSGFADYQLSQDGQRVLLSSAGQVFVHDLAADQTFRVPLLDGELADPRLSPDGRRLAFVLDYDLHVAKLGAPANGTIQTQITRLTRNGTATNPNGLAEFVAQEEMSRHEGYWWSPDGKHLLYQATDQSDVDQFTIADPTSPQNRPATAPYPRAGRPNATVRLFVVGVTGRGRIEVEWDHSAWPYVAKVVWTSTDAPAALLQARDQQTQIFVRIDPQTGSTSRLHEESDSAWINIHDSTPRWLSDGSYLWAAEDEGAWALYHHVPRTDSAESSPRTTVIAPTAGLAEVVHVDEDRGWVWFTGGTDPTVRHLFRGRLDGKGTPLCVTSGDGYHESTFSPSGDRFVLTSASLHSAPQSQLLRIDDVDALSGERSGQRGTSGRGVSIPQTVGRVAILPAVELVPPKHAGGFHAAVIRPRKFDPQHRYPVILYVYGGPGTQVVSGIAQSYMLHQWLADHGFIVVTLDGRGTPGRGRAYERAIRLRFADLPLEDQIAGLQALGARYRQLDLARVGIYGWSFGGYLAALAAFRRPDVFKVAVAGAPVVDWTYYDTHYTERYLGLPQDEPEAYRQANLLTYAKDLKIPLLLIHGIADDNVYFAHSLRLADALFRAGRRFELLPLVGLTHQVSDPQVREALYERMVRFMGDVLW